MMHAAGQQQAALAPGEQPAEMVDLSQVSNSAGSPAAPAASAAGASSLNKQQSAAPLASTPVAAPCVCGPLFRGQGGDDDDDEVVVVGVKRAGGSSSGPAAKRARSVSSTGAGGSSTGAGGSSTGAGASSIASGLGNTTGGAADAAEVQRLQARKSQLSGSAQRGSISSFMMPAGQADIFKDGWTRAAAIAGLTTVQTAHPAFDELFKKHMGVGVPSRTNVASVRVPKAAAEAKAAAQQQLRKVPCVQVSFDGNKNAYCEDSTKMIGVSANLPIGGSVFMGVCNTEDATLHADRYKLEVTKIVVDMTPAGMKSVSGIIHDNEAVCSKAVALLQDDYPHIIDIKCQAHGLNNALERLCHVEALDEMFRACHTIIDVTRSHKSLRKRYKQMCKQLDVVAPLKVAPTHRFAFRVQELRCVHTAMNPLRHLYVQPTLRLEFESVEGIDDVVDYVMGAKLVGTGRNTFKLADIVGATVTALEEISKAIERLEADRPMASVVLPIWRTIIDKVAPLGSTLQRDRRGRGAAAAEERQDFITGLLTECCTKYCTPELIAATLLDPINAIEDGNVWRLGFSWVTAEEKEGAVDAVARIADGITAGSGGRARMQFRELLRDGFAAEYVGLCRSPVPGQPSQMQWANGQQRRLVWELELANHYPELAAVAGRLLAQHATSCSVERIWSRWRKLFAPERSSMLATTAERYMFINASWYLQHRRVEDSLVPEEVFWDLEAQTAHETERWEGEGSEEAE